MMRVQQSEQASDNISLVDVSQTRANNFDFLRFVLASLVILSHSFALSGLSSEPLERLSHKQTNFGHVAVDCFFLISGFLITRSWMSASSVAEYLKRRVLRIYPGYVVAVTVTLFVFGTLGASDRGFYLHSIRPLHLVFDLLQLHRTPDLPAFLHNPVPHELNGSLWSIAIEFQCYLMVIVLGWMGWLRKPRFILALFFLCLIAHAALVYNIPGLHRLAIHLPKFVQFKLPLFVYFIAGMVMLLFAPQIKYDRQLFYVAVAALCAALCTTGWVVVFPLFGGYALFYIAFNSNFKAQRWGQHGDFSYGTYLYAWPIQQLLIAWQGTALSPYLLTTEACVLSWASAMLSWFSIEKPCLKLKGLKLKSKSSLK